MKRELLGINLNYTLDQMRWQTGKTPGRPTGLCHRIVLGALTGADQDFRSPSANAIEQMDEEIAVGLHRYPVQVDRMRFDEVIPTILTESKESGLGIDALVITGRVHNTLRGHAIAAVPVEDIQPFWVVDSLEPDALAKLNTSTDVNNHVKKRFDTDAGLSYSVVPDEQEKEKRLGKNLALDLITFRNQITIYAPIRTSPPHNN